MGERKLRRPLTDDERRELEVRRDELADMTAPFGRADQDHVVLALSDMFGGFSSMRQNADDAVARLDSVLRLLAQFPAWAIVKACRDIQMNGVWRDGKFDKRWPPNDAEIVDAIRKEAKLYADQHHSACALLEAKVSEE